MRITPALFQLRNIFSKYIVVSINRIYSRRYFYDQSTKKTEEQKSRTTDPLLFFQIFPKPMKNAYTSKYSPILTKYLLKTNVIFKKALIFKVSF